MQTEKSCNQPKLQVDLQSFPIDGKTQRMQGNQLLPKDSAFLSPQLFSPLWVPVTLSFLLPNFY